MKPLIISLLLSAVGVLNAAAAPSLAQQADSAYSADNYQLAADLYRQAIATDGTSSAIYYNLGNTYYRLGQNGKAIANYERALRIDPTNADARTNLEFVRTKIADLQLDDGSIITRIVDHSNAWLTADGWAWTSVGLFALIIIAAAFYFFASNVAVRKVSFFGGIALIFVFAASLAMTWVGARKAVDTTHAVVVVPSVQLSTTPRQARNTSEQAFLLHEGTKVEVVDSVATPGEPTWYEVKVDKTHRAWTPATALEKI